MTYPSQKAKVWRCQKSQQFSLSQAITLNTSSLLTAKKTVGKNGPVSLFCLCGNCFPAVVATRWHLTATERNQGLHTPGSQVGNREVEGEVQVHGHNAPNMKDQNQGFPLQTPHQWICEHTQASWPSQHTGFTCLPNTSTTTQGST